MEKQWNEPTKLYQEPLSVDVLTGSLDIPQNDPNGNYSNLDSIEKVPI